MSFTLEEKAYIWLSLADRTVGKRRLNLMELEDNVALLFQNIEKHKEYIVGAHGEKYYSNLIEYHDIDLIDKFIGDNSRLGIQIVTIASEEYPDMLRELYLPPIVLYCLGDVSLLKADCIGVVGTRNMSRYGLDVTENFCKSFVDAGLTVVSGLARGVDSTAHRTVLASSGKTIAVSPCGLDKIYPSENKDLFARIVDKGLVVTEYPLGTGVKQYTFTERNRIISGLSRAVFISEAGVPSGSLITANNAIEQGRDLFVVPGNIYSKQSAGCNKLIKELQGTMVTEPNDVLSALNIKLDAKETTNEQLTIEEAMIINLLDKGDLHFEQILSACKLQVNELNTILLKLELVGIIKRLPGNYFGL